LQAAIKKYNSAKKDSEVEQQKDSLLQLIESLTTDIETLQTSATQTRQSLNDTKSDNGENNSAEEPKQDDGASKKKRLPLPEDQEYAYQLKARMMPHIHAQNENLKAEIVLMARRNELRAARKHQQVNYNRETNLSAVTTLRAIQNYERKTKAAEAKAAVLQAELDQLRSRGDREASAASGRTSSDNFLGPHNRVNDVIKKNETLLTENASHRSEIQRLKHDNAELVRKVKVAQQDRHQVMSHLSTSEMARRDLYGRLQKQKEKHDRLTRSLTRQSAEWIEARKQNGQAEDEYRWNHVGYAAPHGGYERTFSHPVQKNVDQPRYMYPAEKYAQAAV